MNAPVAVLMVPTVLIGWLYVRRREHPWAILRAGVRARRSDGAAARRPRSLTRALVLVVVALGIGVAYVRYGNARALADCGRAVARRNGAHAGGAGQRVLLRYGDRVLFVDPR